MTSRARKRKLARQAQQDVAQEYKEREQRHHDYQQGVADHLAGLVLLQRMQRHLRRRQS